MLVIGVFLEELFFRTLLVPRIGVFFSALAFALLHLGYGSWAEIIGAFILGIVLGWYYKKHQDLFVNFYAHLLYNGVAVLFMLLSVI
jgi:membrane protease YdiL (CAAX protease family)